MKKFKKFLAIFVCLFCAICVFYFGGFILANTLENGTDGYYFTKNFLLEKTKGKPRIIIEAGSGSQFGINSLMIEREFKKFTLNMGYNAGYPLDLRLYRLAKHLGKDDIVVLPLEYIYYTFDKNEHQKGILKELSGIGKFHFNALPLYKKIQVISKMSLKESKKPFKNALNFIKFKLFNSEFDFDLKLDLNTLLAQNERGDANLTLLKNQGYDFSKADNTTGLSCQQNLMVTGIKFSDSFKDYLSLIKEISQNTGAKFIFTYPAMAGQNCYDFSTQIGKDFEILLEQIKNYVLSQGFDFVGDPLAFYFPNDMLDAYYHLNESARDLRTARLIDYLRPYFK